jgi:hypothetical protein
LCEIKTQLIKYRLFNVIDSRETDTTPSKGIVNRPEAQAVLKVIEAIFLNCASEPVLPSVLVLSNFPGQVALIRDEIRTRCVLFKYIQNYNIYVSLQRTTLPTTSRFSSSGGNGENHQILFSIADKVRVQSIDDSSNPQQQQHGREEPSADAILVSCVATNFGRPSPHTIDLGRIPRDSTKGQCLYLFGNLQSLNAYTDEWKCFIRKALQVGRINSMSSLYPTDTFREVID